MKFVFDFFPLALFLIVYKFADIYVATMVIIAASFVQVAVHWLIHRRFEKMHLVSLALFIVLGGMTLYLRDKRFIMWKPTIVNWLFAAAFIATAFIGKQPLIQRMLGGQMKMPDNIWRQLNIGWVLFFVFSGLVNLYFAQRYITAQNALVAVAPAVTPGELADLDCEAQFNDDAVPLCQTASEREKTWVSVKVFGLMGLTILFIIGQSLFLMRHIQTEEDPEESTLETPEPITAEEDFSKK